MDDRGFSPRHTGDFGTASVFASNRFAEPVCQTHELCALHQRKRDPDVRTDMTKIYDRLIKENEPYYDHVLEGADDMPAHAKCSLTGVSLNIPISKGKLNLGTWQGIYLCEFRDYGGRRKLTATIIGE